MNLLEELMKGLVNDPVDFRTAESCTDHEVIIHFYYGMDDLDPLHNLELELEKIVDELDVGRYDGHEIAMDDTDGFLFLFGPNAETLYKSIKPLLEGIPWMKGATALMRFGPLGEGSSEIEVEI